jgi:hypothetical protein
MDHYCNVAWGLGYGRAVPSVLRYDLWRRICWPGRNFGRPAHDRVVAIPAGYRHVCSLRWQRPRFARGDNRPAPDLGHSCQWVPTSIPSSSEIALGRSQLYSLISKGRLASSTPGYFSPKMNPKNRLWRLTLLSIYLYTHPCEPHGSLCEYQA